MWLEIFCTEGSRLGSVECVDSEKQHYALMPGFLSEAYNWQTNNQAVTGLQLLFILFLLSLSLSCCFLFLSASVLLVITLVSIAKVLIVHVHSDDVLGFCYWKCSGL